jgi:UDP-N-acetylmuramate--alanine ligase
LAAAMRRFGHRSAQFAGSMEHAIEMVVGDVRSGDLVITLGAGNVWQAGDRILERLRGGA